MLRVGTLLSHERLDMEPQYRGFRRCPYLTFLMVYGESEFILYEFHRSLEDSLTGTFALHEDDKVIRIADKAVPPPFEFSVQSIQINICE